VVGIGAFIPTTRVEVVIETVAQIRPPRPALARIGNREAPHYLRLFVELTERRGWPSVHL
jgi:hypothetical protein